MISKSFMSRAAKRLRVQLAVTVILADRPAPLVCKTKDVSLTGLFLDTYAAPPVGTKCAITLMDETRGEAVEVIGSVARVTPSGFGVRLAEATEDWLVFVEQAAKVALPTEARPARRLRVLVVADDASRRGALALYVKSGWDVRFATNQEGAEEALRAMKIDAVIAEHDLADSRWSQVLEAARRTQPDAKRIVRSPLMGQPAPPAGRKSDLVHRVVDLEAGLEAVLDALTAEW
jgi:hypothetical protein